MIYFDKIFVQLEHFPKYYVKIMQTFFYTAVVAQLKLLSQSRADPAFNLKEWGGHGAFSLGGGGERRSHYCLIINNKGYFSIKSDDFSDTSANSFSFVNTIKLHQYS